MERFLQCADVQFPVLDERVGRFVGVILQLIVAPTGNPLVGVVIVEAVAELEIPFGAVDGGPSNSSLQTSFQPGGVSSAHANAKTEN